ncbi:MAG TPA: metallophosphoesterase family protein [Chloroflexia bacterium]|nr:metallophosphoesterase family protein [Chloroflexia bacterium]
MKVVIFSDLHANLEALQSLDRECDELWFIGDCVDYGPDPTEAIRFIKEHCCRFVRGNHDHAVGYHADCRCNPANKALSVATREWTWTVIGDSEMDFLRSMPLHQTFKWEGQQVSLFHASPQDPLYGYIMPDIADEALAGLVKNIAADIIILGHSHFPMLRRVADKWVLNPGSLGQPRDGKPSGSYLVWEDGLFKPSRTDYPVEVTVRKLFSLPLLPGIQSDLATILRMGSNLN